MNDMEAVKLLVTTVARGAPYPHPDNPNCIRVAIACAVGMAVAYGLGQRAILYAALEYITNASDEEMLLLASKSWEQN